MIRHLSQITKCVRSSYDLQMRVVTYYMYYLSSNNIPDPPPMPTTKVCQQYLPGQNQVARQLVNKLSANTMTAGKTQLTEVYTEIL